MSEPVTRVVHCKREPFDVYIGRAVPRSGMKGSIFGNPFAIGRDGDRETVIRKYKAYLLSRPDLLAELPKLKGKTLACWCHPQRCHGDAIIEVLQEMEESIRCVCMYDAEGFCPKHGLITD